MRERKKEAKTIADEEQELSSGSRKGEREEAKKIMINSITT
jgi:hypothetical protein